MMGGLGEGLFVLGVILLIGKIWALWRILGRMELPTFGAFAALIPFVGEAILLWWLAFARWPRDEAMDAPEASGAHEGGDLWAPGSIGSTDVSVRDRGKPPAK